MTPAVESGAALIATEGLTKRYGTRAVVDRLRLQVRAGEVFGLLGPNGAGKTTTILMLLGLTERSAGKVRVVGLDPARHPLEVKRRVGYLPDNVGFYATLSGRQNLRYTARLNGLRGSAAEDTLDRLLHRVGLDDAAEVPVGNYSRGMRQRLGIADALVKDPQVVILDEPTIAIDPEGVVEILELIRSLAAEHGAAVLLSSHLLQQVQSICDRVGIFVAGRMIAQGPVAELAAQMPESEVVVEVGADAPAAQTEAALGGIPEVTGVTAGREPGILVITATADVRAAVARRLADDGVALWHLRRRGQELDEIYHRYFTQSDQPVEVAR